MHSTLKICNFRDCKNGKYKQSIYIDCCSVFRDVETGHWYDEMTGETIRQHRLSDGTLVDVQSWLEKQYQKAVGSWSLYDTVHLGPNRKIYKGKPTKPGAKPSVYNRQLDKDIDAFYRSRGRRKEVVRALRESGRELGTYVRLARKFKVNSKVTDNILDLQTKRKELREEQSKLDKQHKQIIPAVKEERKWTDRWGRRSDKMTAVILLHRTHEGIFEINRHGVKLNTLYLYLPETDSAWKESIKYAEQKLLISPKDWVVGALEEERIGKPIRRSGKKNANGNRIKSRADQIRYAEEVQDTWRALLSMKISVYSIHEDKELFKLYRSTIAPRIGRS